MAVFTAVTVFQELLHWISTKYEKVTKKKKETSLPTDKLLWLKTVDSWIDRITKLEKNMEELHQKELEIVKEEERRRYNKLLEKEKKRRQELGIGLHFWKAMAVMAQTEKKEMKEYFKREMQQWRAMCNRYQELYQKNQNPSMEENINPVECKVCMMVDVQRIFGCGHAVCAHCAELLESCHICRAPIRQIHMLFL